ncbi:MAG: hypothetical protein OIF47_00385 [Marinibacterium sp.]|nr:hypothetical protein [Marinibacterium sp.]
MKIIGYIVAILVGWFSWQVAFVKGVQIQQADGPFLLQVLLIWGGLPLGMGAAALIAWGWFSLLPQGDDRSASNNAQTAGVLACIAALTSCGWMAASTQQDPPEALFFPLTHYLGSH